jgi:hypothetical protein
MAQLIYKVDKDKKYERIKKKPLKGFRKKEDITIIHQKKCKSGHHFSLFLGMLKNDIKL